MKRVIFIAILVFVAVSTSFCQSIIIKQTHIPLDNIKGIPYSKSDGELSVDGFDVDEQGNFYFLNIGAPGSNGLPNSTLIVKYYGNKSIYRKNYKAVIGDNLYIYNKYIYSLNQMTNDICVLTTDGVISNRYKHVTTASINSYRFLDGGLIIDVINNSVGNGMTYDLFTLSGTKVKSIPNAYNLPPSLFVDNRTPTDAVYLGKWNNKNVFWYIDDKRQVGYEKFWIADDDGNVLKTKFFQSKIFGTGFENIEEVKKLRGSSIFIFGHNGKDGIITELSLTEMFK